MRPPALTHASAAVFLGDCLDVLAEMPANSVDSIVTDPPYGLSKAPDMAEVLRHWLDGDDYVHTGSGFMGKTWDSFVPGPSVWKECLRVLKPGGHLLAFAGTRTVDLMGLAIRLAGFEMRDSIAWLYGSGFPKSMDVSKAIDKAAGATREVVGQRDRYLDGKARRNLGDRNEVYGSGLTANGVADITAPATPAAQQWSGWGTALKPAFEPIVVARKPLIGTVAANVLEHGTGAINIDGCRVAYASDADAAQATVPNPIFGVKAEGAGTYNYKAGEGRNGAVHDVSRGRWPTNVVLDGDAADELDEQSGTLTSGKVRPEGFAGEYKGDVFGKYAQNLIRPESVYGDTGGASRFFPVFRYQAKAPTRERPVVTHDDGTKTSHPTVKPLALMRWLVRLVTPAGGTVLDTFAGSGATIEAAIEEGIYAMGIEREEDYLPLIQVRLDRVSPKETP